MHIIIDENATFKHFQCSISTEAHIKDENSVYNIKQNFSFYTSCFKVSMILSNYILKFVIIFTHFIEILSLFNKKMLTINLFRTALFWQHMHVGTKKCQYLLFCLLNVYLELSPVLATVSEWIQLTFASKRLFYWQL